MTYWNSWWNKSWIKGRLTIDEDCDNTERAADGGLDAGLGGAEVLLVNKWGCVVAKTTTDSHGNYKFCVSGGTYKVVFPSIDGYDYAAKDVGHYTTDSDANANGATDWFHIGSGCTLNNVDASLKPMTGTVKGNVFCDLDCDGLQDTATAPTTIVMEAEHMHKYGFSSFYGSHASGHKGVKLACYHSGDLVKSFQGADGVYDASIFVQDESDGQSVIMIKVNGQVVKTINLDANNNGGGSDHGGFTKISIGDLDLQQGDNIGVWAQRDGGEYVRIDKLEFSQAGSGVTEPGKAGVTVQLVNSAGTIVATTTTDANGDYQFDGVAAGAGYKVQFVAPDGQVFTQQDVGNDDSIDSDVNAGGMSDVFTVNGGGTVTIDAGLKDGPTANDDAVGNVCEDDIVKIDVLANDEAGDGATITSVDGQAISEGGSVQLANGISVMLMGGQLQIDGSGAAEVQALIPGEDLDVTFSYHVTDMNGNSATANVDLTYCGEYEDLADLGSTLPSGQVMYTITDLNVPAPTSSEAYTVTFMGTGDARFDGVSFTEAYCLDLFLDDGSPEVTLKGDLSIIDDNSFGQTMGIAGDQVDNVINYILNADYAAQGYTDAEIQGAIWGLFNGFAFVAEGGGEQADALAILDDAKANGVDFEVAPGDIAAVLISPEDATFQPFVVGIEYTDCLC